MGSYDGHSSTGEGATTVWVHSEHPSAAVSASLSYDDINDRWMHFSDHVVAVGDLCVVSRQVSANYMEWFF